MQNILVSDFQAINGGNTESCQQAYDNLINDCSDLINSETHSHLPDISKVSSDHHSHGGVAGDLNEIRKKVGNKLGLRNKPNHQD